MAFGSAIRHMQPEVEEFQQTIGVKCKVYWVGQRLVTVRAKLLSSATCITNFLGKRFKEKVKNLKTFISGHRKNWKSASGKDGKYSRQLKIYI